MFKAHFEAIEWIKQWRKDSDHPLQLELLAKVAKAADVLNADSLYRTALKTMAEHATRDRIMKWGGDLAEMRHASLPLLEFLLAEQPSVELFDLLTTGREPFIKLDETDKTKFAAQFSAYTASWRIFPPVNNGDLQPIKTGFCGGWQSCYALLRDQRTLTNSLLSYDLNREKVRWRKDDIFSASYTCSELDTHLLFSIPGHEHPGTRNVVNLTEMQIFDARTGTLLEEVPIPTSRSIEASSKSVITIAFKAGEHNLKWRHRDNQGKPVLCPETAPVGVENVKISPDSNFELLIYRHSVKIRRFRECRPQLIDCEFPHWYTTPDCFAISPCSTSFIASRRQSIWYGQMEQDNSHTRDGTPIQCHHWDITPQLEELDKIADICYSPDGRDIAVVSFMGRILVFENGKGFDEPLLVHDKLLEKYFGECTYKKVTCANWSQSELLLTGTIFGVVAVPIEYAIRKARQQRSRPTKPLNVVFN